LESIHGTLSGGAVPAPKALADGAEVGLGAGHY